VAQVISFARNIEYTLPGARLVSDPVGRQVAIRIAPEPAVVRFARRHLELRPPVAPNADGVPVGTGFAAGSGQAPAAVAGR
jgi:hypothetical protein